MVTVWVAGYELELGKVDVANTNRVHLQSIKINSEINSMS